MLFLANVCYSQIDIPGLYVNPSCDSIRFDLRADSTYTNYDCELCVDPCTKEIGRYSIKGDRIILTPNDSTKKSTKLFYIKNSPTDNKPLSPWRNGNIAPIFESETVLPKNITWRLSDYEALQLGYTKRRGYYDNDTIQFNTEVTSRYTKTINRYYRSGKIKSIEYYYFDKHLGDKKTGNWYFYNENGLVDKIEIYKRNKLKRIKNALTQRLSNNVDLVICNYSILFLHNRPDFLDYQNSTFVQGTDHTIKKRFDLKKIGDRLLFNSKKLGVSLSVHDIIRREIKKGACTGLYFYTIHSPGRLS
ncbi:MAG: hypothetical protein CFE21_11330 [Bacteroidetes bacterium B1(2017)]|nr:MAG: hypothetical protein CFE21_11330 [Bacteroidetes bacterium B1(2017)]